MRASPMSASSIPGEIIDANDIEHAAAVLATTHDGCASTAGEDGAMIGYVIPATGRVEDTGYRSRRRARSACDGRGTGRRGHGPWSGERVLILGNHDLEPTRPPSLRPEAIRCYGSRQATPSPVSV